jgi:hypothetical protein
VWAASCEPSQRIPSAGLQCNDCKQSLISNQGSGSVMSSLRSLILGSRMIVDFCFRIFWSLKETRAAKPRSALATGIRHTSAQSQGLAINRQLLMDLYIKLEQPSTSDSFSYHRKYVFRSTIFPRVATYDDAKAR